MYVPAVFAESDQTSIDGLIDRHPLATLVFVSGGSAHVDHLPFVRLGMAKAGGELVAHVSTSNPTWKLVAEGIDAVLAFTGASAYVSPSLYPTKKITHEVVPTWNYASVHLRGRLRCSHDRDAKHRIVETLTRTMESPRTEPWAMSDAPAAYIEKMLAGVVALEFVVTDVTAKFKASQNRSAEDRRGVVAGLGAESATQEASRLAAEKFLAG